MPQNLYVTKYHSNPDLLCKDASAQGSRERDPLEAYAAVRPIPQRCDKCGAPCHARARCTAIRAPAAATDDAIDAAVDELLRPAYGASAGWRWSEWIPRLATPSVVLLDTADSSHDSSDAFLASFRAGWPGLRPATKRRNNPSGTTGAIPGSGPPATCPTDAVTAQPYGPTAAACT